MQNGAPESNSNLPDPAELISEGTPIVAALLALTKSGWRTTEFWSNLAALVLIGVAVWRGEQHADGPVTFAAVVSTVYTAMRTWAKVTHAKVSAQQIAAPSIALVEPITQAERDLAASLATHQSSPDQQGGIRTFLSKQAIAALLLPAFLFTSCSGGDIDRTFRERVKAARVTGSEQCADQVCTGTASLELEFRDPRGDAKQLQPLR